MWKLSKGILRITFVFGRVKQCDSFQSNRRLFVRKVKAGEQRKAKLLYIFVVGCAWYKFINMKKCKNVLLLIFLFWDEQVACNATVWQFNSNHASNCFNDQIEVAFSFYMLRLYSFLFRTPIPAIFILYILCELFNVHLDFFFFLYFNIYFNPEDTFLIVFRKETTWPPKVQSCRYSELMSWIQRLQKIAFAFFMNVKQQHCEIDLSWRLTRCATVC